MIKMCIKIKQHDSFNKLKRVQIEEGRGKRGRAQRARSELICEFISNPVQSIRSCQLYTWNDSWALERPKKLKMKMFDGMMHTKYKCSNIMTTTTTTIVAAAT